MFGSQGLVLLGIFFLNLANGEVSSSEVRYDLGHILVFLGDIKLNNLSVVLASSYFSCTFIWLHGWEEHNLLNVIGVGQKHGDSVNSKTPSSSWWETIFKSSDETLVNMLSFKISSILGSSLSLESLKLNLWVVQFCVGIDNLMEVGKQFKSFRKTWFASVPFGKWRHNTWSVDDKSWALALALKEFTDEFVNKSSSSSWVRALNTFLLTEVVKEKS